MVVLYNSGFLSNSLLLCLVSCHKLILTTCLHRTCISTLSSLIRIGAFAPVVVFATLSTPVKDAMAIGRIHRNSMPISTSVGLKSSFYSLRISVSCFGKWRPKWCRRCRRHNGDSDVEYRVTVITREEQVNLEKFSIVIQVNIVPLALSWNSVSVYQLPRIFSLASIPRWRGFRSWASSNT